MPAKKSRKGRPKGRAFRISLTAFLLIVAALLAGLAWRGRAEQEVQAALDRLDGQVRGIREIVGARSTYREVIYLHESFLMTGKTLLFALDYQVDAGLDLSDGFRVMERSGGILTVGLPPARILRVDAREETMDEILIREILWEFSTDEHQAVVRERAEDIRRDAAGTDLLDRAELSARRLLEDLFREAGFPRVRFVTLGGGGDGL